MTSLRPPDLTPIQIHNAIKEALLDHPIPDISHCQNIKEGADHHVWSLGPDLILRGLPITTGLPTGKSESSLRRDAAVTALLHEHLPPALTTKIPSVMKTITIPPSWICNIEQRLPGRNFDHVPPTAKTLSSLSELLSALTDIPISEALAATGYEEPRPNLRTRVTRAIQGWTELIRCSYVHDAEKVVAKILEEQLMLVKRLEKEVDTIALYRPALLHGDLHGEHILVGEVDGEVLGLIDWSDALVGDPCRDLAGVVLAVGREKAREVGVGAGYDAVTVERGLLYAMCLTIRDLKDRVVHGDKDVQEELLRTQFRRCFQGTEGEHILEGK